MDLRQSNKMSIQKSIQYLLEEDISLISSYKREIQNQVICLTEVMLALYHD